MEEAALDLPGLVVDAVEMPMGEYVVRIESMLKWFSSTAWVKIEGGVRNVLRFGDREGVWDGLFWIAMVMEIVHMFISLPMGWNIAYHVVDEGLFVGWIVYELSIRKRYFRTRFEHRVVSDNID